MSGRVTNHEGCDIDELFLRELVKDRVHGGTGVDVRLCWTCAKLGGTLRGWSMLLQLSAYSSGALTGSRPFAQHSKVRTVTNPSS